MGMEHTWASGNSRKIGGTWSRELTSVLGSLCILFQEFAFVHNYFVDECGDFNGKGVDFLAYNIYNSQYLTVRNLLLSEG